MWGLQSPNLKFLFCGNDNHYEDGVDGLRTIQFDTRVALMRAKHLVNPPLDGIKHGLGTGALNPNNDAAAQKSLPESVENQ